MASEATLVMGVIGSDVHAIGNKILAHALENASFKVVNLGVMTNQQEFVAAALETNAAVVLVSSLYGHGEMDCRGLKDKFIEAGLEHVLLYIGGNLVVGKQDFEAVRQRFLAMGFDRVYPPGTTPEEVVDALKSDLG